MVAKAYYTSSKSHVEIGKEFNTSAASVSRWSRLYRHKFLGELSIRQASATFNAVPNLSPTINKPDLTPEQMAQRILELEAQAYVEQIIGLYNSLRPHQSLSYLTPDLVHRSGIATQRKWKNYPSQSKGKEVFVPLPAGRKVKE